MLASTARRPMKAGSLRGGYSEGYKLVGWRHRGRVDQDPRFCELPLRDACLTSNGDAQQDSVISASSPPVGVKCVLLRCTWIGNFISAMGSRALELVLQR